MSKLPVPNFGKVLFDILHDLSVTSWDVVDRCTISLEELESILLGNAVMKDDDCKEVSKYLGYSEGYLSRLQSAIINKGS